MAHHAYAMSGAKDGRPWYRWDLLQQPKATLQFVGIISHFC